MSTARSVRAGLAGIALLFCVVLAGGNASAQPAFFDTGEAPIVQIGIQSGDLIVNTWDRPGVQVESPDNINFRKVTARFGNGPGLIPFTVPMLAAPVRTPDGDNVTLPPENFVFSTVTPGAHDAILVTAGDISATVHIPANTALLVVRAGGAAQISVNNYRSGTFIVHARGGVVRLINDGGDGFVQVVNGNIAARDSSFNRIRVRTAVHNIAFENCSAKQIEASTISGSIIYDHGTFQPGLAHFESERGNVAIGVAGGARINAQSQQGRIVSSFDGPVAVQQRNGQATTVVGGGGALVNASSGRGSVYLYDGTLGQKRGLSEEWQGLRRDFPGRFPQNRSRPGDGGQGIFTAPEFRRRQ